MRRLAETDPGSENDHRSYGRFWAEDGTQQVRGTLWILMGAAALILLIASANVASLLLARNSSRSGELALRKAIGAGQLRLVRQLLTETTVIALVGGFAGVALAQAGLRLLIAFAPPDIPRLTQIALDLPVLLFASAITLAAGLAAGLAPVLFTGKLDLTGALKEGWRLSGGGRSRQAFRNLLVIGEVALTFVLTFGSGLLLRSLLAAQNASPGFQAQQLLSFELQLPSRAYRTPEAVAAFYTRLLEGLRAIPGVTAAGAVYGPPGGGDRGDWFYSIAGRPAPPRSDVPVALFNIAEAGYFPMMGIPLRGRDFNDTDRAGGPKVAIVNQTFARLWWPGESPLGHRIKVGGPYRDGPELEIVGVAGDVKQDGLDSQPMPELYQPFAQKPGERMAIMVRSAGDPAPQTATMMAAIRARVLALDRNLPVQHLETMEKSLGASLARRRFSTLLLTALRIARHAARRHRHLRSVQLLGGHARKRNRRTARSRRASIHHSALGRPPRAAPRRRRHRPRTGRRLDRRARARRRGLRNRAAQSRDHARSRPCRRRHRDRRHRPACLARRADRRGPPPALRLIHY